MAGETAHATGADGARRAKRWLERTTRVRVPYVNPDEVATPILTFEWHEDSGRTKPFSFDMSGYLVEGDFHSENFFAESKKYKAPSDQGTEYRHFLAKCYVALRSRPQYCHHFFWITWAPFLSTSWEVLATADFVKESVLKHPKDVFGVDNALAVIDDEVCKDIAERLWIIVLSEKQEDLTISEKYFKYVRGEQEI